MNSLAVNDHKSQAVERPVVAARADTNVTPTVLVGDDVIAWMQKSEDIAAWDALYRVCPWGTAFQTSGFSKLWYRHYGDQWTPVLALGHDATGALAAIMPLTARNGVITGVGAYQAEYHGWLSTPAIASAFLKAAISAVTARLPHHAISLKYLHAAVPQSALNELIAADRRARLRAHIRGVLDLDRAAIAETLKKKGNRSKLNRLKRLGSVEFRVLSPADLERHMDDLTAYCDFRQGAVNDSCPFADDPRKRQFHLDWLRELPNEVHVSGYFLDGRMISALFLGLSAGEAHIAIVAHSPEHAENSPNKFHIYEAALALADSKFERLDMTPGGDEWKLRFASREDAVHELEVYASASSAILSTVREAGGNAVRGALKRIGISPSSLRSVLRGAPREQTSPQPPETSWDSYQVTARPPAGATTVIVNPLQTLLKHGPAFAKQPRQAFLSDALRRLESGERAYVIATNSAIDALAWAEPDPADEKSARISWARCAAPATKAKLGSALLASILEDVAKQTGSPIAAVSIRSGDNETRAFIESADWLARRS